MQQGRAMYQARVRCCSPARKKMLVRQLFENRICGTSENSETKKVPANEQQLSAAQIFGACHGRGVHSESSGRAQLHQRPTMHVRLHRDLYNAEKGCGSDAIYLKFRKPDCTAHCCPWRRPATMPDRKPLPELNASVFHSESIFSINLWPYYERGTFVRPAPESSPVVS